MATECFRFGYFFFPDSGLASGEVVNAFGSAVRAIGRLQGKGLCAEALALS